MDVVQEKKETENASRMFAAGSVVFFVVLGQGLNMLQEMLLAAYFGTTWITDAYKLAMAIPMNFSIESMSIISAVVIPVLYTGKTFDDQRKIFSVLLRFFILISAGLWVILLLCAAPLFTVVAGGFTPEGRSLSISIFTVTSSIVALTILASFAGNALNSLNEFGVAASQKVFMFGAIVAALYFGAARFGIAAAAWGAAGGMILFLLVAFGRLFRLKLTPIRGYSMSDPAIRQCLVLGAPLIVYSLFSQFNGLFEKKIAADFPGGTLSALDYALKSSVFFINFIGVGVTTVIFPTLSERNIEGDMPSLRHYADRMLLFVVLMVSPFVIFLLVYRTEFIQVLFERGAFTQAATSETSSMLGYYALGLLGHGVFSTFPRFFQAIRRNATIMRIGIAMVAVNILGLLVFPSLFGPVGIPIAFILTYTLHALILLLRLNAIIGFDWKFIVDQTLRIAGACILFAALLLGVHSAVPLVHVTGWIGRFGILAAICIVSGILYMAVASMINIRLARDIVGRGWDIVHSKKSGRP